MIPYIGYLTLCATLASTATSETIKDSTSPDGKFHLIAESKKDGISYLVVSKDGSATSAELKSDFGMIRPLEEASSFTSVHWRPDNAYVTFFTGHDRHHVDFFVLALSGGEFKALPVSWDKWVHFSQRTPLGFGYPAFLRWLPQNQIEDDLFEHDGINVVRDSAYILNLTEDLKPVSWRIVTPEHKRE